MSFAAPWALWGVLLLVGPVLVHLLSRRTATRRLFPTLRFIEMARLQPVSRRRLEDRALLALRLLIVALAVLALAGPQWGTDPGAGAVARGAAMVLLVDTSASMERDTPSGRSARDEARRLADSAATRADRVLRVETADPAAALPASAAWLQRAGGGTLVLLTDAQRGTLTTTDVAALPPTIRFALRAIALRTGEPRTALRGALDTLSTGPELVVRSAQRSQGTAFPREPADTAPITVALVLALADVAAHPLLREVLARSPVVDASATVAVDGAPGWITVLSGPQHSATVLAWVRPSHPVVLQLAIDESHPAAEAIVAITRDALHDARTPPPRERDATVLDGGQQVVLERAAGASAPAAARAMAQRDDTSSQARWLWALVLLALTGEWWMRTRMVRIDAVNV